jgi:hypothetical protein
VNNNSLATVKYQIEQEEKPMPAVVITMEPARFINTLLLDYVTSKVGFVETEIKITDPHILVLNKCMDDKLHVLMARGSGDYENENNESDKYNAIPTAIRRSRAATDLKTLDLGTSNVHRYMGTDGDNVHLNKEEQESQANDGSTENLDD